MNGLKKEQMNIPTCSVSRERYLNVHQFSTARHINVIEKRQKIKINKDSKDS